ncbi:MAG: EipA family protein [Hyphomicrobium sp.]
MTGIRRLPGETACPSARRTRGRSLVLAAIAMLAVVAPRAAMAECTTSDFAIAVDQSGAALRAYSRETQPTIEERMLRYKAAKGLPDDSYREQALDAIGDARLEELDAKSSELLLKIDGMGRVPDGREPVCAELDDIKAMSSELLVVMRTKTEYIISKLDAEIAKSAPAQAAAAPKPAPAPAKPPEAAAPAPAPAPVATARAPDPKPDAAAAKPEKAVTPEKPVVAEKTPPAKPEWSAATKPADAYQPPVDGAAPPPAASDTLMMPEEDGYSIEEIQNATRGFFGTVSTSLASVIEHAFKTTGRPTAYVLGTEGGGAFLAGLRFGDGTLFMRNGQRTRKVWWHGPSLGTDFGVAGARTMFLIYRMNSEEGLFRRFTGVDGSAFLVGGVGMTVLKGGDVIMAPIRTGLGLRFGANIGYVRFTPQPTWNPF